MLLLVAFACQEKGSSTLENKLFETNEVQRTAHLTNDAALLVGEIADSMLSLNAGQMNWMSKEAIQNRFENYFDMVRYTSWDDVTAPIIEFDQQSGKAKTYVQKFLDLQYLDANGDYSPHQYAQFAWQADYVLEGEKWKMISNTSTERSLTKEEADKLRISHAQTYAVIDESDLIPEGVAFDDHTGITYLSSTYKRKVVAVMPDGSYFVFKHEGEDGLWSVVGMEVDEANRSLWVVSLNANDALPLKGEAPGNKWASKVMQFDLDSRTLSGEYMLEGLTGFNDLCITPSGLVYVTESLNNKVYQIDPSNGQIDALAIEHPDFIFPNGITVSSNGKYLYIATRTGILQYVLADGRHQYLTMHEGIDDLRLDGLAYYQGTLIGNQSYRKRIMQYRLNEADGSVIWQRILEANHPDFDQPATGEVTGDSFIFLANAQMQSGFENGKLRSEEELEEVKLLKLDLKHF